MKSEEWRKLDQMFNPRGLAVFGAVKKMDGWGHFMLMSHRAYGFSGGLYPISPQGGEVAGMRVYRGLSEVEGPVDLASVSVPARNVSKVLRDCLKHGVVGAEIHTAGFAETGESQGAVLQDEIMQTAKQGLRIIGPNCFGVHCPRSGLTLLPGFDFSREPGPVAMISQSGGVTSDFGHEAQLAGLGISKLISFGNGCDVEAVELLEYFADDPETGYVAAYLEGVSNGQKFLEVVKQVTRKKPVVVWKGGLTPLGSRAAMSHTGSLGGEARVWDGALTQAGAISVQGIDEMMDTLMALKYLKNVGRRIALAGGGGAIGVFSSDLAHQWGLEVPTFSSGTQERLKQFFTNPGSSLLNPLDTGMPVVPLEWLTGSIKEILGNEPVDVLVLILLLHPLEVIFNGYMEMDGLTPLPGGAYLKELVGALPRIKEETGKDIVIVLENRSYRPENMDVESTYREMRVRFQAEGIPVFVSAERALRGIRNAARAKN